MTTGPILWGGANTAFNLQGTMKSNAYIVAGGGGVQFNNSANTFSTTLEAGSNTANATFQLPIADGSSGQFLSTNGSGVLSFASAGGGGGSPAFNVAANDSNVTFTSASNPYQSCNPTANRTYTLPSTGVTVGTIWAFYNQAVPASTGNDSIITLQAADSTVIDYVIGTGFTQLVALSATPGTAANWETVSAESKWCYDNSANVGTNNFNSGSTSSNMTRYYKRNGNSMDIRCQGNIGTTSGSVLQWLIPGGGVFSVDSNQIIYNALLGYMNNNGGVTTEVNVGFPFPYGNYLIFMAQGSYSPLPGNTWASNTNIVISAYGVPITNWGA